MEKIEKIGQMEFHLVDNRCSEYNESVDCIFPLYGLQNDGVMSIETYFGLCKQFAAAMGFAEKTIDEWFGEY